MSDDLTLHPRVRHAIYEGKRDKPLTLNWAPVEPDAYDCLGLPSLNSRNAMKARVQIITEALAAGERWISYSRDKRFYTHGQRYYRPTYTYYSILPAVGQLADAGLIEHEKVRPGYRGFQSRFKASPILLKEMVQAPVVYRPLEIIILRDAEGNPIDYRDNRETRRMRRQLSEFNEALTGQRIAVGDRTIREGDRLDNGGRAQAQLHRVFHRGDFNLGGRFYGAYWQNIPAEGSRDQITINGEPTTEVDYTGLHIRLLYAEQGLPAPADPYEVGGWPRKQIKLALLIAINARTHIDAVRALADALRLMGGVADSFATAQALIRAAKARHPHIAHAIGSDAGVRLMRQDSEIAAQVMCEVIRATGIAPLPVHDSFIVPANQKEALMAAMENALPCQTTGGKNPCQTTSDLETSFSLPNQNLSKNTTDNMGWSAGRDGEMGGGGVERLAAPRARLDDLSRQLDRFKPSPTALVLGMAGKLS